MPEVCRFYGIIIRMYLETGLQYNAAHVHAYYQNEVAVFAIDPVEVIAGSIPKKQMRLVEAWAELHQQELIADWELLQSGRLPSPIIPLQ